MQNYITVVCLRSLSYTGTTWLNSVLGGHPDVLALGPIDAVWDRITGKSSSPVCLIHGHECDFWPDFVEKYREDKNLFIELAQHSGKSILITNNLSEAGVGRYLQHPKVRTKYIQVVRDGRALTASYHRKFPHKKYYQSITEFLQPSFQDFYFDPHNQDVLCLRYEDVVKDQEAHLSQMGDFLGVAYSKEALEYWKWNHHLISGNQGTISALKFHQGLPVLNFESRQFYEAQFNSLQADSQSFSDERQQSLTRLQRYIFDALAGCDNQRFGYTRDSFLIEEHLEYNPIVQENSVIQSFMNTYLSNNSAAESNAWKRIKESAATLKAALFKGKSDV
jgi:hypothetical protein